MTPLIAAWRGGDQAARDRLVELVYADLRRVAGRYLRRERRGHTLQPTALVHEALLRLLGAGPGALRDRAHLMNLAAGLMRRVLVDHARRRLAAKREGLRVTLDEGDRAVSAPDFDVLALDHLLEELGRRDPRKRALVELRFFGGLELAEAAEALGVSTATAKRDWSFTRAWLFDRLRSGGPRGTS